MVSLLLTAEPIDRKRNSAFTDQLFAAAVVSWRLELRTHLRKRHAANSPTHNK
jgi:hypothetical protein